MIVFNQTRLKTGDIFSMDEEGYLFFKSRSKDIIIRGGANIYPAEIESFLKSNDQIIEAQAFGVNKMKKINLIAKNEMKCIFFQRYQMPGSAKKSVYGSSSKRARP